jgi:WD40 repeat protein
MIVRVATVLLLAACALHGAPVGLQLATSEEAISQVSPHYLVPFGSRPFTSLSDFRFVVSPDGRHVAFAARHGDTDGSQFVRVDNVEQQAFPNGEDLQPIFSPDSMNVAYVVTVSGRDRMVLNGNQSRQSYAQIRLIDGGFPITSSPGCIRASFSSTSKTLAYIGARDGQCFVNLNGIESAGGSNVVDLCFSPDGSQSAFIGERNGQDFVNLNSKEVCIGDAVANLRFSPNGKHLAYALLRDKAWHVVLDGVESPPYAFRPHLDLSLRAQAPNLVFSENGEHFGYEVCQGDTEIVVVDGKEIGRGDVVNLALSPDGSHTAFYRGLSKSLEEFLNKPKGEIVVDGQSRRLNAAPTSLCFSPDNRSVVCVARPGEELGAPTFVWIDGKSGRKYGSGLDDLGLVFSPDGRRVAYSAYEDNEEQPAMTWIRDKLKLKGHRADCTTYVIVDGKERAYPTCLGGLDSLVFSPDSRQWACALELTDTNDYAVLNGKRMTTYKHVQKIGSICFSPDSRHFVMQVTDSDDSGWLVIDGLEEPVNGEWVPGSRIIFDTPNRLHSLIGRETSDHGITIFRLAVELLDHSR